LEEKTMVIITADHGKSHGEHDSIFNHGDLYEPTVHVPLIMKDPSLLPAGKESSELVENIDLVPTI
jgi:arylsulfatase A-like enzyme